MSVSPSLPRKDAALYRTLWRWHFYAGLFVIPFILILSVTGAIYLFKPQIDQWEERAYRNGSMIAAVDANTQLAAALKAFPGAQLHSYRLAENRGDAAMLHMAMPDGHSMRDVYVSPQGKVLGIADPERSISATVSNIHGSLLLGKIGDWLVELAASWAIVMILTGLYLWWPDGRKAAGIIWPRFGMGKRTFLRDLHAVTGFWISGLVLVLLLSGLPWTSVWGEAFQYGRTELGLVKGAKDWKSSVSSPHAEHDHAAMLAQQSSGIPSVSLSTIVEKAKAEKMVFPVIIIPPGAPQQFGAAANMVWTVKSVSQNRPLNRSITFDAGSGEPVSQSGFADKHAIDRVIGYGLAWHEGQLFGWANQVIGVLTAIGLIILSVSGFLLWRKRRPKDVLGAPPIPQSGTKLRFVAGIILVLAALLPLLAASLILLWLFERLLLPRLPRLSQWLGVTSLRQI